MGHQTEIACWIGIAESRDRTGHIHHSGNHSACVVAELSVFCKHHVASGLRFGQAHVYVQTRSGFSYGDLRGEGHIVAHLARCVADYPFCYSELVGGMEGGHGEEFDLVLLVDHSVGGEIAYF